MLPIDGIWRGWQTPKKPGDFVYENKLPWGRVDPEFSRKDDPLEITGKRLDGPAPEFTENFGSSGFGPDNANKFIMGGISIPAYGCWQITGRYKGQQLRFTVWVTHLKEAPSADASGRAISPESYPNEKATHRIYVDAGTEARLLVYEVAPRIPPGVDAFGTVLIHAIIGTDGRPRELQYVDGPRQLVQAAMDTVMWQQYRIDDETAEVDTTIEVAFPSKDH
jgi:hypothetical protein